LWWGVPLVLVLTLPWFAWANIQTDGEFFRVFFWRHNIDRGIGTDETLRALPWWYYGPELARGLLPWSLLLPFAVYWLWRNPDRDARFGAVWLLAVTAMLSCVRFKRADYLLPAFPGAALILGCVFERWHQAKASRRLPVVFGSVVVLTTALWLGYISWIVPAQELARTHRAFAAEVRKHAPGHVVFFRTEAHVIGFHAGPPLDSVLEWENLDIWSGMPQTTYVVMPRQCWDEWQANLTRGTLEAVTFSDQMEVPACRWPEWFQRFTDFGRENRERPYVLARTKSLDAKR
jgi:hypothetical protein